MSRKTGLSIFGLDLCIKGNCGARYEHSRSQNEKEFCNTSGKKEFEYI